MANAQISPGNAHPPSPLCAPPHLRPRLPDRYWTLKKGAFSSGATASHAVSVRRAMVLPAASFRFHLAMETLAARLTLPPVGRTEDFHLQVGAHCRAHKKEGSPDFRPGTPQKEDDALCYFGSMAASMRRCVRSSSMQALIYCFSPSGTNSCISTKKRIVSFSKPMAVSMASL